MMDIRKKKMTCIIQDIKDIDPEVTLTVNELFIVIIINILYSQYHLAYVYLLSQHILMDYLLYQLNGFVNGYQMLLMIVELINHYCLIFNLLSLVLVTLFIVIIIILLVSNISNIVLYHV